MRVRSATRSPRWSASRRISIALVEEGGGEALDALAHNGARDCERVDLIGLADLALAAATLPHDPRRHADHALAGHHQGLLEPTGNVSAILECPDAVVVERARPAQRLQMASRVSGDRLLRNDRAGRRVDRCQRMRALVSVRTDHDHVPPSLQREKSNRIAGGQTSVKACCQAPIKSRPRSSSGGRRQTVSGQTFASTRHFGVRPPPPRANRPVGQTAEPSRTMTLTTLSVPSAIDGFAAGTLPRRTLRR
jgi:hypothetical protein